MVGKNRVANVNHVPEEPIAGKGFVVVVELTNEVGDFPEEVVFEKQRIVADPSGFAITRPTGSKYFVEGFEPAPIRITSGKFGTSKPIVVDPKAVAPEGEEPISFPEKLLISAYIGNLSDGFRSDLIYIASGAPKEFVATFASDDLTLNQKVPNKAERDVVGAATAKIVRGTAEFKALSENKNSDIVFKDEEGTGADRMMTARLKEKVDKLATLVKAEWPSLKLRITEAWDENDEHGANSVHYEARGADLTTSDQDSAKLGRLGRLAVNAGFEWVFYENTTHIHASMSK